MLENKFGSPLRRTVCVTGRWRGAEGVGCRLPRTKKARHTNLLKFYLLASDSLVLKVFWHFFGSGYFHVVLNFWHSRTQHNQHTHTHIHHKHFAYISGACPRRQWSRVIRRHCCNFLLGLIYFKVFRMQCQLH